MLSAADAHQRAGRAARNCLRFVGLVAIIFEGCGGSPTAPSVVTTAPLAPASLSITTNSLPQGTVDSAYTATLQSTGGTPPLVWAVTLGALPTGLTLSATTGVISGTPSSAQTSAFTMSATDAGSPAQRITKAMSITIAPSSSLSSPAPLAITAVPSSSATVGVTYSSCAAATGGVPPYLWDVATGAVPNGLTLDGTTGCITGVPTAVGTFSFALRCTDRAIPQSASAQRVVSITIQPAALSWSTNVAAEIANNTSAASSMTLQGADGQNATPGNVSKIDVHVLLAPMLKTLPVYSAMMGWWTKAGHVSGVGYSSTDPVQVQKQLDDMRSRGINGMTMAWYGQGDISDLAFDAWRQAAETSHTDFKIALRVNEAIVDAVHCPSGDQAACIIGQLKYASKYFTSSAYLTYDVSSDSFGPRPVVTFFFPSTLAACCDWSAIRNAVTGNFNPIIVTRKDKGGFNGQTPNMDGGFAWSVYPDGFAYDSDFDAAAQNFPGQYIWTDASKGFDDQLASWGSNRMTPERCGNRWLETWAHINNDFSASPAGTVDAVILPTWNDYEEGTEIETGIDNCYTVATPAISGSTVSWKLNASNTSATIATVDHFTLYLGDNSGNLLVLEDNIPATSTSTVLPTNVPQGAWSIYVKMVGKPSILNRMSPPAAYSK